MDAAAVLGRNPVSKHQIQPEYGDEQADAGRDCQTRLARPISQARTRTRKYLFSLCSADHEQDWQPYPVDPYTCYMCVHTYIILLRSGYIWVLSWLVDKIRWVSTAFTRMVTQWIGFCRLRSFSHVRVGSRKIEVLPIDLRISV